MISLMLLPFRALVWLVLGCIFSLPWLLVLLPITMQHWLPIGLSYGVEKLTGFPCKIQKAEVKLITGEIILHNVSLSNPDGFFSSDFLKFKAIDLKLKWTSLLNKTLQLEKLKMECFHMCSLKQSDINNLQLLCENVAKKTAHSNFNKGCLIEEFQFNFKGLISLRTYIGFARSNEFLTQKNFSYKNVCFNVPEDIKGTFTTTKSFENVYNTIREFFNQN